MRMNFACISMIGLLACASSVREGSDESGSIDASTDSNTPADGGGAGSQAIFDLAGVHTYVVPEGCTQVAAKAWGAGGGHGAANLAAAGGGYAEAELSSSPGAMLLVLVGEAGLGATGPSPGSGGEPGGGPGGNSDSRGGGGGGGYSAIFDGGPIPSETLLVAGGGGGSGGGAEASKVYGGWGGGVAGGDSISQPGAGQLEGFGALAAGQGGSQLSGDGGGGGGGGWYGGFGGVGANDDGHGGSGGSGYVIETALQPKLEAGTASGPGNPSDPDRGAAADPGAPGKVILTCLSGQ